MSYAAGVTAFGGSFGAADAVVTAPATRVAVAASAAAPAIILDSFRITLPPLGCPSRSCAVPVRRVANMPITTLPGKMHRDKGTRHVGKVISQR